MASQTASTAPQGTSGTSSPAPTTQHSYPPIGQLYQVALSDYNAGRYDLAAGEFATVVKDYPYDQLSGHAQFYVGESYYRERKYQNAIKAYEQVLSQYPGSAKAPAARLHKAYAELAMGRRAAGIKDLKALIGRFPQSPEAAQGRLRLNGLLASSTGKPSPYN
jgi:tol-pal system protein YbgF